MAEHIRDVWSVLEGPYTPPQIEEILAERAKALMLRGHPVCQHNPGGGEHCLAPADVAVVLVEDFCNRQLLCVEHAVAGMLDILGCSPFHPGFDYEVRAVMGILRTVARHKSAMTIECEQHSHQFAILSLQQLGYSSHSTAKEEKDDHQDDE